VWGGEGWNPGGRSCAVPCCVLVVLLWRHANQLDAVSRSLRAKQACFTHGIQCAEPVGRHGGLPALAVPGSCSGHMPQWPVADAKVFGWLSVT
jgi:hypothetical protein